MTLMPSDPSSSSSSSLPYFTPNPSCLASVTTHSKQLLLPCPYNIVPFAATAIVIGLGGLGSPVVTYLATMGVGRLILIDGDSVELSNLHRQFAHPPSTIGQLKTESAATHVKRLSSHTEVVTIPHFLTSSNIAAHLSPHLLSPSTLIFSCLDSHESRLLLSTYLHTFHPTTQLISGCASGLTGEERL